MFKRVAVIYLSYHSDPYLDRVMSALKSLTYPKELVEFVVVDAPHLEFGTSLKNLESKLLPLSGNELPHVTIIPLEKNFGFAKNNNTGIKWALEQGFEYVYLHNQDGFMEKDCLVKLVEAMEKDKTIGAAQSLIMLYPETELINSAGNAYHFLGFGYCDGYRRSLLSLPKGELERVCRPLSKRDSEVDSRLLAGRPTPLRLPLERGESPAIEIAYASGASLLLRADLLKLFGLLDEDFISYHEDLEYSLRLKSLDYKITLVPAAKFFHEYSFSRNKEKFYLMERNRFAVLLMYYNGLSLILILPAAIVMEIGLIFFALMSGWLREKFDAYHYWLDLAHIRLWLAKRKVVQNRRMVSDRKLLESATGVIKFEDAQFDNPILKYIANPLMEIYWWIIKFFII